MVARAATQPERLLRVIINPRDVPRGSCTLAMARMDTLGGKEREEGPQHLIWGAPEISESSSSADQGQSVAGGSSADHRRPSARGWKKQIQSILADVEVISDSFSESRETLTVPRSNSQGITCDFVDQDLQPPRCRRDSDKEDNENVVASSMSNWTSLHASGECTPCRFVNTKAGCRSGSDCTYCHLSHRQRIRARPCKAKRAECRQKIALVDTIFVGDEAKRDTAIQNLYNEGSYMRTLICSTRLRQNLVAFPGSSTASCGGPSLANGPIEQTLATVEFVEQECGTPPTPPPAPSSSGSAAADIFAELSQEAQTEILAALLAGRDAMECADIKRTLGVRIVESL